MGFSTRKEENKTCFLSNILITQEMGKILKISKKQPIVSFSTIKTEFIATTTSVCQAMWMRRILRNLKMFKKGHVHFSRDLATNEEIKLVHYENQDQVANLITKALKLEAF
ncbi:hypothetical protein CR513_52914, partial [Mucuna pruriens]